MGTVTRAAQHREEQGWRAAGLSSFDSLSEATADYHQECARCEQAS